MQLQDPITVNCFDSSLSLFVHEMQKFTLVNVDKAMANWFMDNGAAFIANEVASQHAEDFEKHRRFAYKQGASLYAFTPHERGYDIAIIKKLVRKDNEADEINYENFVVDSEPGRAFESEPIESTIKSLNM